MKIKKHININGLLVILALFIFGFGFDIRPDDKELFIGGGGSGVEIKPNVMILMDSSGSMNGIIFYPKNGLDNIAGTSDDGYDPGINYSGTVDGFTSSTNYLDDTESGWYARWVYSGNAREKSQSQLEGWSGKNFWTGCYAGDGTPDNFQVGSFGTYFRVGDKVIFRDTSKPYNSAVATLSSRYTKDGNNWFKLTDIEGGPITVNGGHFQQAPDGENWNPVVINMYGTTDLGYEVRWLRNYVEWVFIHAADEKQEAVSHFSTWGTFDVNSTPAERLSDCATPGNDDLSGTNPRIQKLFTRIQTAREVVCRVASDSNDIVKLGLFKFNGTNGGTLQEELADMADGSSELVAYKDNVWGIAADSWTPLAEALADVWYYFKPGPNSKTYWPVDYEIDNNLVNHPTANPVTPIDWYCQTNYVVIMTDGESSKDGFNDSGKYGDSAFLQKPVKRSEPWTDWDDGWGDPDNNDDKNSGYRPAGYSSSDTYCPNYTCWLTGSGGTDLLDDVAYFLRHQDMFPDDHYGDDSETGWPGDQNIYTYTIGFNFDNHMLEQAAVNGEGAYYTANSYLELVDAFRQVITSINLRNFAFASITAPRKTATATDADLTVSYVGYFLPSVASALWEGHLVAFELQDQWGFDADDSGGVEPEELVYDTKESCLTNSSGKECLRSVSLSIGQEWDIADPGRIPADRALYTHNNNTTKIDFNVSQKTAIKPLIDASLTDVQVESIIDKIREPRLADIFHSDVSFIGAPPFGKQLFSTFDPPGESDETFATFYSNHENRAKVLYAGTNDGIYHMFYADGVNAGHEAWGFIPDEVLPSLKKIVLDGEHTYTVDGRATTADIYFKKPGDTINTWSTVMVFGLRDGGNAYYALDISDIGSSPKILWKFKDSTYSGKSYGKPVFGRLRLPDPDDAGKTIARWVVFLAGGFGFNSENAGDQEGKSVFILDAATGELLYMIGFDDTNGAAGAGAGTQKEVAVSDNGNNKFLTQSPLFNFPIPGSFTAVDADRNGFVDTLYFGNTGGHMFKTDVSDSDIANWQTFVVFEREYIADKFSADIELNGINGEVFTMKKKGFTLGDPVMGKTSYATGYITDIDDFDITVTTTSGTFVDEETLVTRTYDPIFHTPAVFYDQCGQLWVAFGTGDRDRPRTNSAKGRFIAVKDNGTTNLIEDTSGSKGSKTLQEITFGSDDTIAENDYDDTANGFFFDFPDDGEKIFDPKPFSLPDKDRNPHIYFNTYQPPSSSGTGPSTNPCAAPPEGNLFIYDIALMGCGTPDGGEEGGTTTLEASRNTGRFAGGGGYGQEDVIYTTESGNVGDVHGDTQATTTVVIDSTSGEIVYWKEKKR
ncbi:MAG: hypothetical protein GY940_22415 [bacterium]|nr:hypothetical protein [bacterium]